MTYIVEQMGEKTVNTKFGPKSAYSMKASGEWYSCGFKKPKLDIGDEIDFQFTENDYGKQMDDKSVRVITKGSGGSAPATAGSSPPAARTGGFVAKVFPIPYLHGDRAIVRQNSVTNATKMVGDSLVRQGLGGSMSFEETAEKIIMVARMFEAYSCGDLDVEAAEKLTASK